MSDLALQLSQLDIEPIEIVSTHTAPDLDLERLLAGESNQNALPTIVDSNVTCTGGCACASCFPPVCSCCVPACCCG